ncbi:hypothetical protein [Candidatus Albibeggiatoa sp. nov. NOAA]|uniref:hypothetical protein n=1 Tax=Candidatus Albibeggiatoa sp. nov. NOAA TaxID=3162724 RepID=UPI0032F41B92|nr:hypothetical protein [Thiotrichaceae bacterium]
MHYLTKILLTISSLSLLLLYTTTSHANSAPRLLPILDEVVVLGQAVVVQPKAVDIDRDPLQFKLRYTPPSAVINSQTGLFSWRPSAVGTFKIAITVEETNHGDDNLSAQQVFNVTVISRKLVEFGLSQLDIEKLDSETVKDLPDELFSIFDDLDIQKLPPETFEALSPEQFAQFTASAICGITEAQFSLLPFEHLGYLNAQSITGFTPQIIRMFNPNHLKIINDNEIRRIPSRTVANILTNLDTQQVLPQDIEHLLPVNWKIDRITGKLSAPAGASLTFRALNLDRNISAQTQLPYDIPDLNTHLALGGDTDDSVLSDLNELLAQNQLSHLQLSQNKGGVVSAKGLQNGEEIEYAMMPDPRRIIQKANDDKAGLNISGNNSLELVTSQKQAFSMLPAPKSLAALEQLVGEKGSIKVDKNGEVLLRYFDEDTQSYRRSFVMFDYIVQKSPNRRSQRGRIELPPRRNDRLLREIREGRVVYNDGSTQNIYPTVLYPEVLIGLLYAVSGMELVTYNIDGSFAINLSSANYVLLPLDGFTSQTLDADEVVNPSIHLQSENILTYIVQSDTQLLTFSLLISV